jgi:uncharacterized membrane protein
MKSTQFKMGLWLAKHSVLMLTIFFIIFAALPILAPILLAQGYTNIASVIYRLYGFTCHQLPSHSDYIGGYQIAVCQRCNATHIMLAVAGLMYGMRLFRPSAISFRWFLLFMIPIGIDGGMAFVSELLVVIPIYWFWILGMAIIIGMGVLLHNQKLMSWQVYLFFAAGPVSLLLIQIFGPHESNWGLRTITGALYGLGAIWFIYPMLEESFPDRRQDHPV